MKLFITIKNSTEYLLGLIVSILLFLTKIFNEINHKLSILKDTNICSPEFKVCRASYSKTSLKFLTMMLSNIIVGIYFVSFDILNISNIYSQKTKNIIFHCQNKT